MQKILCEREIQYAMLFVFSARHDVLIDTLCAGFNTIGISVDYNALWQKGLCRVFRVSLENKKKNFNISMSIFTYFVQFNGVFQFSIQTHKRSKHSSSCPFTVFVGNTQHHTYWHVQWRLVSLLLRQHKGSSAHSTQLISDCLLV